MKYILMVLIALISIISCDTKVKYKLSKIPADEIVKRVKDGQFNYNYASFLNQKGLKLSEDEKEKLNEGLLGKDYYEDESGRIKEVRVRPIELQDKFIEIQRRELSNNNPLRMINLRAIDCQKLDSIYSKIYEMDQNVRINDGSTDIVDSINQGIVVSALTKCGWTEKHLETIWMILQHSSSGLISYYYSDLKRFSEQNKLKKSSMALMEDRLLMWNGYKQIYGSQIRNGSLYDLEEPQKVNERRKNVGLEPIEDYILKWNLDFKEEIEKM